MPKTVKKAKDPNAPKEPQSAYILFIEDNGAAVKDKLLAGSKVGDIDNEMGKMWGEMDPKDKAKYETLAATAKAEWEKKKADYEQKGAGRRVMAPCDQ